MKLLDERGIVLVCSEDGIVQQVVRDDFGLSLRVRPGSPVSDLVDPDGREKVDAFLGELRSRDAAYDWEIAVPIDGSLLMLHFGGARLEHGSLVMAASSRNALGHLNDAELMRIDSEQTNALRNTVKALAQAQRRGVAHDDAAYEQLSRLNNEMVNLQRELAKKNAELQRYYHAAEEEQRVAGYLMQQLVRADLLHDPLLSFWIEPAQSLSGDLVAAARTPEGVLQLLLADGMGHGLVASLNVLPIVDPFYAMTGKGLGVSEIAREVNGKIKRWLPVGRFAAAALIAFDPRKGRIEVWCGGLPPPVVLHEDGRVLHEFASAHLALGVLPAHDFDASTESFQVDGASQLIVFSDGSTEAEGQNGKQFGRGRLLQTLSSAPPAERMDRLKRALSEHLIGRPAVDDISIAILDCGRLP